jgi:transposase InsO family protein
VPSDRQIRRLLLSGLVADIHKRSRGTYGMLRIRAALMREQDMVVNKKLILSIVRELGIKGLPGPKKRKKNLVNEATEEDLVQRNFTVDAPNVLWLTDITEHPTREGKVYCCVVLDAFSRRVVGWAIDRRCETALVNDALMMASESRPTGPASIIHSDHGRQFTSWGFSELIRTKGSAGLDGHRRRLLRQHPHGVVLGLDADRAAQPQEVADQDRALNRHRRVDRALLQPRASPQLARLPSADRIRGPTLGPDPDLTLTNLVRN